MVAETAVVRPVSVAVKVQPTPVVIVTAEKVATPLTAATLVVPIKVQPLVMVTVSPLVVSTLPLASSTLTTKVASATPAVAVVGGAVVKTTLDLVPALSASDAVTAVGSSDVDTE